MKTEYQQVFSVAVMAKVKAAEAMQSKTSWTTRDHLGVLADLLVGCTSDKAKINDVLSECYNVSAFAQTLEKVEAFKKSGHFQRTGKGTPTLDSLLASLSAAATAQG